MLRGLAPDKAFHNEDSHCKRICTKKPSFFSAGPEGLRRVVSSRKRFQAAFKKVLGDLTDGSRDFQSGTQGSFRIPDGPGIS